MKIKLLWYKLEIQRLLFINWACGIIFSFRYIIRWLLFGIKLAFSNIISWCNNLLYLCIHALSLQYVDSKLLVLYDIYWLISVKIISYLLFFFLSIIYNNAWFFFCLDNFLRPSDTFILIFWGSLIYMIMVLNYFIQWFSPPGNILIRFFHYFQCSFYQFLLAYISYYFNKI